MKATQAADTTETPRRPPRILVVDDERSMRELLAIVLRREGYEVLLAENGRTAIETLEREPVDLLISDIKMPDLSGVDVLRAAKKIDQDILGIMVTAFASTESAVEAMRLGACDYLSKPFDVDLLRMKVREKIDNRQLKQENVLLEADPRAVAPVREHHRPQRSDARRVQDDRDRRQDQQHDPADGRVRHRQGPGRAGHPLPFAPPRQAARGAQLRRDAGGAARVGALRPHARRVHRGRDQQEGAARSRREGDHLPRRNRRDEPRDAGQAPARAAGAALPPRRRPRGARGRHPRDHGHEPGPREGHRRWPLPRGPVLPHQCHSRSCSRRSGSGARTSRCWPITSWPSTRSRWGSRSPASHTKP